MADKKFLDQEGLAKLWELINDNFEDITAHDLDIEELRQQIEEIDSKTDSTLSKRFEELEAKVDTNKEQTDAAIESKIAEVIDNAPEAFNTLKELADYVANDDSRALGMIERINELEKMKALSEAEIEEICERVAMTTKVADVAELAAALTAGGIVKLANDMAVSEAIEIPAGASVELDLNGKTLTSTVSNPLVANGGELTISNGAISSTGRVAVASNGGKLTLDNVIVDSGDVALQADGEGSELVINSGEITAQECGALVTTKGAFTMNGGTITSIDNAAIMGNGTVKPGDDRGNVVINFNDGELNMSMVVSSMLTKVAVF